MFDVGEEIPDDSKAVISGWGGTESGLRLSSILLQVEVPVVKKEECNAIYSHTIPQLREDEICAGLYQSCGEQPCPGGQFFGDCGGPVTVGCRLAGIVSWSKKQPGLPGVHAEVAYHRKWIDEKTEFETMYNNEATDCSLSGCLPFLKI